MKVFKCQHSKRNEVTADDCRQCQLYRPKETAKRKLLLKVSDLAPGDVLVMTAALESLHATYPDEFITGVRSSCAKEIFEHNPLVTEFLPDEKPEVVSMHYPLIDKSNQEPVHFLAGFCRWLGAKLGRPLEPAISRPVIHLSKEEIGWIPQVQEKSYWVVNAGHKMDFTAKFWGTSNYQAVVNELQGKVRFVQVGEAEHNGNHRHAPLEGVINLVGKTDTRQLIRLCYHAAGGLGPSTFIQHIFAAFHKPYVCLLGGREPVQWVQYPKQTTLHTIGALDCCRDSACWKSRTVPLKDGKDASLCEKPVLVPEPVPQCLSMISPRQVAQEILKYSQR